MCICMQKINFIPSTYLEILVRYCKLVILHSLRYLVTPTKNNSITLLDSPLLSRDITLLKNSETEQPIQAHNLKTRILPDKGLAVRYKYFSLRFPRKIKFFKKGKKKLIICVLLRVHFIHFWVKQSLLQNSVLTSFFLILFIFFLVSLCQMLKKLMSRFQASLEDAHSCLGAHEDKHEFREPF